MWIALEYAIAAVEIHTSIFGNSERVQRLLSSSSNRYSIHECESQSFLPFRDPTKPVEEDRPEGVNGDIHPEQPEIPPASREVNAEIPQVLARVINTTILALLITARGRIQQVPPGQGHVVLHVLAASPIRRRRKRQELVSRAVHRSITQARRQQSRHQVRERVDPIHEDPETRERMRAGEDAAEGVHHDAHDVCERGGELGALDAGDEEMRKGAGEEEGGPDDEEDEGASGMDAVGVFGVAVEADGVEPGQETENCRDLRLI